MCHGGGSATPIGQNLHNFFFLFFLLAIGGGRTTPMGHGSATPRLNYPFFFVSVLFFFLNVFNIFFLSYIIFNFLSIF
jgi:hypothetical protein